MTTITYDRIAEATGYDQKLRQLRWMIQSGTTEEVYRVLKEIGNPKIGRGWNIVSNDLTVHENCIMVQNRV